jgi:hypothetical protein
MIHVRARGGVAAILTSAMLLIGTAGSAPAHAATAATPPPHDGYILMGADGGIFNFDLPFNGSPAGSPGSCAPTVGIRQSPVAGGSCLSLALTPSGDGYWVMNALTGLVFGSGDAGTVGTPNDPAHRFANVSQEFLPQFRQIVATPSGHGYWVYEVGASDIGTVDPYGDALSYGDTTKLLQQHVVSGYAGSPVAMAATPDGKGYWEVYSDGGVFAFGDAHFFGSMAGHPLFRPIVGITATADGKGYWLVASDGGVFAFGDAHYAGGAAGIPNRGPIVDMTRNPQGTGYWLTSSDGGVYSFGGAQFFGSIPQVTRNLNAPIVAIVAPLKVEP